MDGGNNINIDLSDSEDQYGSNQQHSHQLQQPKPAAKHQRGPSQQMYNQENGIEIAGMKKNSNNRDNSDNADSEEDKESFDDISDGIGDDNEGVLPIGHGLQQLNHVRNNQADKSAFAQEQQINMGSGGQQQQQQREFLPLENNNLKPEVKELLEIFPDKEPAVIQDIYEQLNGNKDLVVEYLMNGHISERALRNLNNNANQAQQRERSAFEEDDEQQQPQRRGAHLQQNDDYYQQNEGQDNNDNDDKDAELARQLQQQEYDEEQRNQRKRREIEQQKKIEREIRRQQAALQQQPRTSNVQRPGSAAGNRSSIPNVYELPNQEQNEQIFDSDQIDRASRNLQKADNRRPEIVAQDKQNIKKRQVERDEGGGFFSMFCGCFAAKPKKDKNNGAQAEPPRQQQQRMEQMSNGRAQQYMVNVEQLDKDQEEQQHEARRL